MHEKRYRITLLFNANKVYDRQVVEGVGEYLQASQTDWDIFIEEDFRCRIDNIHEWLGDAVIGDYDDSSIEQLLANVDVPIVGVGGSYHRQQDYPPVHYIRFNACKGIKVEQTLSACRALIWRSAFATKPAIPFTP